MSKSQSSQLFKYFEYLFSLVSLIHISQAIIPLFLTKGANEGDGINVTSLDLSINAKLSLIVYFVSFVLLALRWRRSLAVFSSNVFLWILLGIVCFSFFWSINPDQTFRFSTYAVGTTAFGLYLATRYSLLEQMKLLGWTYGLLLILSLLFAIRYSQIWHLRGCPRRCFKGRFYSQKSVWCGNGSWRSYFFAQCFT